ncbi:MAG: hypothetical protein GAK28_00111 [Luteibacter sp.]|uniref:glycine-rich domain-containing protein n=1 Tax=Luteibacter sp. TaxID=1886636 RepID=UPI00137E98ED|nr:hypothetical protein [Luteibacter sp.]KAF1009473.1 MAG: hypothetical protein GAK28_00111 [Luteibacter sp.]
MDRKIVYPGQIPLETDLLGTNQSVMVALGKLMGAIFGTGGAVNGLTVGPNTPAALNVVVAPGEIYQLMNLEATAYSSLPADNAHTLVKQGILLDPVTLACAAPPTAGFSVNYLIEATYSDSDTNNTTLPYYNASNPSQAYSGPNNSGAQQATTRAGIVQLQVKSGVAAATGTQTTPAVDNGFIALAVVTVANGQTTITSANIVGANTNQITSSPISIGRLITTRVFSTPGTFTYNPSPGTRLVRAKVQGSGAAGSGTVACGASQVALGGGGSAGSYCESWITSGFSGLSVVVGAPGVAVLGSSGGNGGSSSFGGLMLAPGGIGSTATGTPFTGIAMAGGVFGPAIATGGTVINGRGGQGNTGIVTLVISNGGVAVSGSGGASAFGPGGDGRINSSTGPGFAGTFPGSGGGGSLTMPNGAAQIGGNGAPGIVIIEEYA